MMMLVVINFLGALTKLRGSSFVQGVINTKLILLIMVMKMYLVTTSELEMDFCI